MKVSLNLAQKYSNVDLKGLDHVELLRRLGAQLGAIEEVIDWGARYQGIVVAKVVSCVEHPDSDHMHVCMIDDGGVAQDVERDKDGLVQVVCGAPNIAAGHTVAWLAPGSTVPASFDEAEPFVLGKRELRGHVSNGMIGSAKELAIADSHEGILEITASSFESSEIAESLMKPGTPFVSLYGLDDLIIDCENKMFTHRPDCFGNLGVAREIAGIFGLAFESPEWYENVQLYENVPTQKLDLFCKVETDLSPRFMVVAMSGAEINPSPIWMQSMLTRLGHKPISNVVDVTNFVMHLTGQPLHAFDYDKLKSINGTVELYPRMAKDGEELSLLNGKTVKLTKDDIVISCGDKAVALGGVMGGAETEVDENTKNIVIECANFDMYAIRRTSMRHGLFTDAVTRFNKGQSPLQNDRVLAYATKLMAEISGAKVASEFFDLGDYDKDQKSVQVSTDFIASRLGATELTSKTVQTLLSNVEFGVDMADGEDEYWVKAPFWRTDINIPEDLVEEVGRLYGYDKLPVLLPRRLMKPTKRNATQDFKTTIRTILKQAGANEVLTYSFVHGDLMRKTGLDPDQWAYHVRNAISPDLQYYRTTTIASLLDKVQMNIRADYIRSDDNDFALFEIGKSHTKGHESLDPDEVDNRESKQKLPDEFTRLALVFAADEKTAGAKYQGSAYYEALKYLQLVMGAGVVLVPCDTNEYPVTSVYQIGRSACIMNNGEPMGMIGEIREDIKQRLKLPAYCAGFEIDLSIFAKMQKQNAYQPIGTFPKTQQDVTYKVENSKTYEEVRSSIWTELQKAKEEHGYEVTIAPRAIFHKDGEQSKNITFRIWLNHPHKTLKTEEVNSLLDEVSKQINQKLGAERV